MSDKTTDVATRFVDLALKHMHWEEIKTLPADEVRVLFDTVSAAGFNPKIIKPGKLVGHYFGQDSSTPTKHIRSTISVRSKWSAKETVIIFLQRAGSTARFGAWSTV